MSDQSNKKSIGALWKGKSSGGTDYIKGNVEINGEKHKIIVFKNTYKSKKEDPDYKVYESTDLQSQGRGQQRSGSNTSQQRPAMRQNPRPAQRNEEFVTPDGAAGQDDGSDF